MGLLTGGIWAALILFVVYKFARSIRLVPNRKAFIVERLGKYHQTLGPGFHVLLPFIDQVAYQQDLREMAIEVPPQEAFTRDNVKVEVDGVLYISVEDPEKASYGITDYRYAAIQLAQTTTRSVVGVLDLDRTFEERDEINKKVVSVLDEVADTWGIKVHRYEIKNIVPPNTVRDAMEQQMAAERQRRALLAQSEGQKQAMINDSEGRKQEMINASEGEKAKFINEAQGQAQEILSIAQATAESIRKMGAALTVDGGADAIRLRLSQKYIKNLGNLANASARVLMPADISRIDELLKAVGLDAESAKAEAARLREEAKALPPRQPRTAALKVPVGPAPEAAASEDTKAPV
ncbi:MAG: paraslipin, partial [Alphaproteobacteria bacterium]